MSMSSNTSYAEEITSDDDFFTRWLKRLYYSVQTLKGSEDNDQLDADALISRVISVVDEGKEKLPKWLSSLKKEKGDSYKKILSMTSIGTELKNKLGKLRTPNAVQDLNDIHHRYAKLLTAINKSDLDDSLASAPCSTSSSIPIYDHGDNNSEPTEKVLNFLSNIEDMSGDNLLEFCHLADANHRYHSVSKSDKTRIQKLLAREKARAAAAESSISLLEKRLRSVSNESEGNDSTADDRIVSKGLSLIRKELNVSSEALRLAETEEETARLAYEKACQKRKRVAGKVSSLEDTICTVKTHKKLIEEVSNKRLDLAKYSSDVAMEGIQLISEFQTYVKSIQSQVGGPQVNNEIPVIFSHIISSFTGHLNGDKSMPEFSNLEQYNVVMEDKTKVYSRLHKDYDESLTSMYSIRCLAQIGLELTRLWRQLNAEDTYTDEVWATIKKFEQEIQTKFLGGSMGLTHDHIFSNLVDTEHIPRYEDTTVVLCYDHLQHLTPRWHFENIQRMTAALKLLSDQKSRPVNYDTMWILNSDEGSYDDDSGPSKRHCRRGRDLEILNCNDVIAPPLWTLPMTHSPAYLQHLHEVAIKAHKQNIYAPLEFESDFDDDDEDEGSDDFFKDIDDKKYVLSLNSDVSKVLGPDLENHFLSALRIDKKDSALAKAYLSSKKNMKKSSDANNLPLRNGNTYFSSGRVGQDVGISFSGGSKGGDGSNRQPSMRVITPFGMGIIVEKIRESDGIQKVALDWGAICYFNFSSVQVITDSQQMKDSVGNVLPPHIRSLLSLWRAKYVTDAVSDDEESDEDEENEDNDMESHDVSLDIDDVISPYMKFIVNCLVNICGVQRTVADLFKINPSTFSAWLNGRASDSMRQSAIKSAKKGFRRYSYDEFVKRIQPKEDTADSSEMTDTVDDEDDDESEVDADSTLKTNSSNKRKISCPRFEYDMYSLTNFEGYKGQASQRPPKKTPQSEQIRSIVQSLMNRKKLTETQIAQDFSSKFEPMKPGSIVSWLSYRTNYQMDAKINFYIFLWIEERKGSLTSKENKIFEGLRSLVESTSNPTQRGCDRLGVDQNHNERDMSSDNGNASDGSQDDDMDVELTRGVDDSDDGDMVISDVSDNDQDLDAAFIDQNLPRDNSSSRDISPKDKEGTPGIAHEHDNQDDMARISTIWKPEPPMQNDINTLRFTIIDEIMRRGITQTTAAEEANLCIIGLTQTAISKLLHKGTFGSGTKASNFKNLMEDWVANSKLRPSGDSVRKVVTNSFRQEISDLDIKVPGLSASQVKDEKHVSPRQRKMHSVSEEQLSSTFNEEDQKPKETRIIDPEFVSLRDALVEEMKRRACYQSTVISESGLSRHGFSQPNISRFIHSVYVMGGDRGVLFKNMIRKWIKFSQRKYPPLVRNSESIINNCKTNEAAEDDTSSNNDDDDDDNADADVSSNDEMSDNDSNERYANKKGESNIKLDNNGTKGGALLPVLQLREEVMREIHRRAMSQRGAAIEAKFEKNGLPLCTVNRLINSKKCNGDASGIKFRQLMQAWLKTSKESEPTVNHSPLILDSDESSDSDDAERNDKRRSRKDHPDKQYEILRNLQHEVRTEIRRRNLYQSFVAKEANLKKIGCDQSHLSRFLLTCRMPGYGRADSFQDYMTQWVELSKSQESFVLQNKGKGSADSGQRGTDEDPAPRPTSHGVINQDGLLSTEELQLQVNKETYRRSVSISTVFMEADIASSTVSNSALARYLQKGNCPVGERGIVFRKCLENWLNESRRKPENKVKTVKDRTLQVANTTTGVVRSGDIGETRPQQNQRRKAASVSDIVGECPPAKQARTLTTHVSVKKTYHVPLVYADRFKESFHHAWCKECNGTNNRPGKPGSMLECGSCPYSYHTDCVDSSSASFLPHPSSNNQQGRQWYCPECRESGACFCVRLKSSEINSDAGLAQQPWVLFYASHLRRWRQGYVCDMDITRKLILCKWWRTDNKWGKSNWINISNGAPLLWLPKAEGFLDLKNENAKRVRKGAVQDLLKTNPQYFGALSAVQTVKRKESIILPDMILPPESIDDNSLQGDDTNDNDNSDDVSQGDPTNSTTREASSSSGRNPRGRSLKIEAEKEEPEQSNVDTYLSADSLKAAICAAGIACRAVDIVLCGSNTNVFSCCRPPGHHAGRRGFTEKCRGTGFCLLNNAAIAMLHARVRWGIQRVAVVDIDVHFGNGTSELLKNDPRAFFGCVHMIYGKDNEGFSKEVAERRQRMMACCGPNSLRNTVEMAGSRGTSGTSNTKEKNALDRMDSLKEGFFPHALGCTEIQDNYISIGVYPEIHSNVNNNAQSDSGDEIADESIGENDVKPFTQSSMCGPTGFRKALKDYIIPQMEKFDPELLIISAGFDGMATDPLGGDLGLTASDYVWATNMLLQSMNRPGCSGAGRVVSLLEGGYDIKRESQGLASAINAHVKAMRKHPPPPVSNKS